MRVILRYFHNPKTDKLVLSPSSLAFALKHKSEVENIVHWHDTEGWIEALAQSILVLKSRLLVGFWKSCMTIIGAFGVMALLWWMPLGLPIKWGWAAFSVLMLLPFVIALLGFYDIAKIFILGECRGTFCESAFANEPIKAPEMACPTMLLSKQKEEIVKKWPALISLLFLLAFMGTIGRMAVPLRGWVPIIHNISGEEFATEEIHWLAPSEFWEYAPRFIRGTAYGLLYYQEDMERVYVIDCEYVLENTKHRSPISVKEQVQIWISNMSNYFAMTIRSGESVDLNREELLEELKSGIESEPVQVALQEALRSAAKDNFEEEFTTLKFEVGWISIDEYANAVR